MADCKDGPEMTTRKAAKRVVKNLFLLFCLPIYLIFRLLSLFGNSNSCFTSFSQGLSLVPGKVGVYLRAGFYRLSCPVTSDDISIGFLTVLSHQNTSIARGVYIGPQCNIGMCAIGENTLLGSGVHILSGSKQHGFDDLEAPIQDQGGTFEKVQIGTDCWIGNQAIVMAPVPDKTIIAAGSVVTRALEIGDVVAGNPARVIRNRFDTDHRPDKASGAV
jgi:acetyltransferase-like isoleucine patch superfamily enzyme